MEFFFVAPAASKFSDLHLHATLKEGGSRTKCRPPRHAKASGIVGNCHAVVLLIGGGPDDSTHSPACGSQSRLTLASSAQRGGRFPSSRCDERAARKRIRAAHRHGPLHPRCHSPAFSGSSPLLGRASYGKRRRFVILAPANQNRQPKMTGSCR